VSNYIKRQRGFEGAVACIWPPGRAVEKREKKAAAGECQLYAVDDKVVWKSTP
jgi:hypothetical protein